MLDSNRTISANAPNWPTHRTAAIGFGAVFALLGLLGPLLGGPEGELIVFGRNYLHDVVHIGSGLAGLAAGLYDGGAYAGTYLKGFGAVYLLVVVAGLAAPDLVGELLGIDAAINALHLVLTVGLLGAGVVLER